MAIREEDIDNRKVINMVRNGTKATFMDLLEVVEKQSEYRAMKMTQKRSRKSTSTSQSLEESTQMSFDGISPAECSQAKPTIDSFSRPGIANTHQQHDFPPSAIRLPKVVETTTRTTATATATTSRRIVSDASIAAPEQDSAGGTRVFANNEKASDGFANNLIRYLLSTIWPNGVVLDWVDGRDGDCTLVWNSK